MLNKAGNENIPNKTYFKPISDNDGIIMKRELNKYENYASNSTDNWENIPKSDSTFYSNIHNSKYFHIIFII